MKMKKRLLGVLLGLAMVLGLMPGMSMIVYADDTDTCRLRKELFSDSYDWENRPPYLIDNEWGTDVSKLFDNNTDTKWYIYWDEKDCENTNLGISIKFHDGDVISFVNVNSSSIEISSSVYNYLQFGYVVVHYSVADSYTVTYDPGRGSGTMNPTTVRRTDEGKYPYTVENCGFTAPLGERFDCWMGSDGLPYKPGAPVELTGDLTLTALWKDRGGSGGSGIGADIVFNNPGMDYSWEYVGGGYVAPQRAYRVSFAPMQGGSAYFMLNSGETGETMNVYPQTTVRVVPTPAPGYRLASIVWSMIDGSASYDITEAQNFVMPAMDVVVYVIFQPVG